MAVKLSKWIVIGLPRNSGAETGGGDGQKPVGRRKTTG